MYQIRFHPRIVYFGREVIRTNWNSINKGPLTRAGNLVRMFARQSIRRRLKRHPSPAGTPPFSHVQGRTPPFKMIYSLPIYFGTGVIVGMVGFNPADPVPGVHEHGLAVRRRIAQWKLGRKDKPRGRRQFTKSGQKIFYNKPPVMTTIMAKYPLRQFMGPALEKAWPQLPPMWRNSITRPS